MHPQYHFNDNRIIYPEVPHCSSYYGLSLLTLLHNSALLISRPLLLPPYIIFLRQQSRWYPHNYRKHISHFQRKKSNCPVWILTWNPWPIAPKSSSVCHRRYYFAQYYRNCPCISPPDSFSFSILILGMNQVKICFVWYLYNLCKIYIFLFYFFHKYSRQLWMRDWEELPQ